MELGEGYLNKSRSDVVKSLDYLNKITTEVGLVMRVKVQYFAGINEFENGCDLNRAKFHFEKFLELVKLFKIYSLKREIPDIVEMCTNAKEYIR
jgi:hypothetical protein